MRQSQRSERSERSDSPPKEDTRLKDEDSTPPGSDVEDDIDLEINVVGMNESVEAAAVDDNEDWEYGITRWNLLFFGLYLGTTTSMYILFIMNAPLAEYDMPVYYTTNAYDMTTKTFEYVLQQVTVVPLFIAALVFMTVGVLMTCVVFLPFINNWYFDALESGVNNFKWIDFTISSVAMNVLVAAQFGVGDLNSLIPVVGLSFTTAFFFYLYERCNVQKGILRETTFKTPLVFAFLSWFFIWPTYILSGVLASTTGEWNFGQWPAWLYVEAGFGMLYTLAAITNQILYQTGVGKWGRDGYEFLEKVHIINGFVIKNVMAWLIFVYASK